MTPPPPPRRATERAFPPRARSVKPAVRTARLLTTNDLATIAVGVGLWLVALVLLYSLQASGAARIPPWCIWTAVGGSVLGTYGTFFLWRRDQRARRAHR